MDQFFQLMDYAKVLAPPPVIGPGPAPAPAPAPAPPVAVPVELSPELRDHLKRSLAPQEPSGPTTALHRRLQALSDGSDKVAQAIETSGTNVTVLTEKLGTVIGDRVTKLETDLGGLDGRLVSVESAIENGAGAGNIGDRLDRIERRLADAEKAIFLGSGSSGSGIPPAELSVEQIECLRALTQVDAQLFDQETSPGQMSANLAAKFAEPSGRACLNHLRSIGEDTAWKELCAPVSNLEEQLPQRIAESFRLRSAVLQKLHAKAARTA